MRIYTVPFKGESREGSMVVMGETVERAYRHYNTQIRALGLEDRNTHITINKFEKFEINTTRESVHVMDNGG